MLIWGGSGCQDSDASRDKTQHGFFPYRLLEPVPSNKYCKVVLVELIVQAGIC